MKNLWRKYGWVLLMIPLIIAFLMMGHGDSPGLMSAESVMAPPGADAIQMKEAEAGSPSGSTVLAADTERKVIKEYDLTLQVGSSVKTEKMVQDLLARVHGYVQESQLINEDRGSRQVIVTLRVPSEKADEFCARLSGLGRILDRRMTTQDVTKDYQDLQSRLRNWQRQEEQLLSIMQRSGTVADVLAVAKELGDVREKIESLTGEIRFLSNKTDFALIRLTLSEHGLLDNSSIPGLDFLNRLWSSFWESFKALFVLIVGILPWLAFAGLIWWLWRKLFNRKPVEKKEAKKTE